MEDGYRVLNPDERFRFACHSGVPCFNECCRDVNQFLTPYDILCLRRHLGISTGDFLSAHTVQHAGPETGLPVVSFRLDADRGHACPFVTDKGCSVYEARPASCRAYPLARVAARDRKTGKVTEQYLLLEEQHCRGREEDAETSVPEWIMGQGLPVYNKMNDMFMELIALKNQCIPGPLDARDRHVFHLGCYDLDRFLEQQVQGGLLGKTPVREEWIQSAPEDDTALMKLGFAWVRFLLFSGSHQEK